jgi:hypothetical protein
MLRPDAGSGRMAQGLGGRRVAQRRRLRAVYTLDPVLVADRRQRCLAIDADSLAWHEDAAPSVGACVPRATTPVRALWMEFTPCPR